MWKNHVFPLTLPTLKLHCYERQGLRTRMNTGVSCSVASVALPPCGSHPATEPQATPAAPRACQEGEHHMATGLTKTALTRLMAEKNQLTNKQAAAFLDFWGRPPSRKTRRNGVFVI